MYFNTILVTFYWLFPKSLVTFSKEKLIDIESLCCIVHWTRTECFFRHKPSIKLWRSNFVCVCDGGWVSFSGLLFQYTSVFKRWVTRVFCTSYCRHSDTVSHPAPSWRASLKNKCWFLRSHLHHWCVSHPVLPLAAFCSKSSKRWFK